MPFERNLEPTDFDCPTCGSTLEEDTQSGKYFCRQCGSAKVPDQPESR